MRKAFSLLEVIIAIGLIVVIAGTIIAFLNPGRQFADARNNQRWSDINAIVNAVVQNVVDNEGSWTCANGALPTSTTNLSNASGSYNIASCLVPDYLPSLPFDPGPNASSGSYTDTSNYDLKYSISRNASTSRISVTAPQAELGKTITVTR